MKVRKIKEIHATAENKVGLLAQVSSAIASAGVNIAAVCAYAEGNKAYFMLVTEDSVKAVAALKERGYKAEEKDVVEVKLENNVGALEGIAKKLAAAGVDLNYIYGTVGEGNAPATIIFSSNADGKAMEVLG